MIDVSQTIKPKSDQLNADDMISGPINTTVQGVRLSGQDDQPICIDLGQGLQPFKPCKSMRRLLIFAWGKDGAEWVGRLMTLYNDPEVTWAGQRVGGIRISHMSDINGSLSVALTTTRGKRKPYTVEPFPAYPQKEFDKNLSAWQDAISNGKTTADAIILKVQQKGALTEAQKQLINNPSQSDL